MTLDSGNIMFIGYSLGFPGEGASNDSGVIENIVFRVFGRCVFGTLGNEANIVIYYYLVACRLSRDPKIRDLNDLEWLEWPFYVKF